MQEIGRTGMPYVFLDVTHKSAAWLKERFPQIYEKCKAVKVDMATREFRSCRRRIMNAAVWPSTNWAIRLSGA
jgi:hypothetical protein